MPKNIYHNNKSINHDLKTESLSSIKYTNIEQNVNINKLLNKVKINEQNEKKQIFFFFGMSILSLSIVGIFLSIN